MIDQQRERVCVCRCRIYTRLCYKTNRSIHACDKKQPRCCSCASNDSDAHSIRSSTMRPMKMHLWSLTCERQRDNDDNDNNIDTNEMRNEHVTSARRRWKR